MDAPPVQYVKTSDGYNIAYTVCGEGRPLVFHHVPFVDVQALWEIAEDWLSGLSQRFQLIQFDPPGHGLSTRNLPSDTTLPDLERGLPTVVDHLGLERFLLSAFGAPVHVAVRYAHAHSVGYRGLSSTGPLFLREELGGDASAGPICPETSGMPSSVSLPTWATLPG